MDTAFLEVWYSVIGDNFTSRQNGEAAALQVSLMSPLQPKRSLFVKLPIDEVGRRDSARLQLLREAMELFTILSVVNNRAFTKFFDEYLNIQPTDANSTFYYPQWRLCLVGTLASTDPAAMQSPVSWGTLLGFPRDRSSYSPDFQTAYEKLEALGVEEASKKNIHGSFDIYWKCLFHDSHIESGDEVNKPADTVGSLLAGFEELFRIRVPPIFQFHASGNDTKVFEVWQNEQFPTTPCESVVASPRRTATFTPELTAALTWTRIQSLHLSLYSRDVDLMDDPQTVVNVGFMLNTLLCGRSLDAVLRDSSIRLPPTRQVGYNLTVSCDFDSDALFIATCSAVSFNPRLLRLRVSSVSKERWSWLIYALCCGTSSTLHVVPPVNIARSTLTQSDLKAIKEVLLTNYPRPVVNQGPIHSAQYGFVDMRPGAELYCSPNGTNIVRVVSGSCRCRALYNPANNVNSVEMIVPGFGACKARLGNSIGFTPDSNKAVFKQKRVGGSLSLNFVKVEDTALLVNLLALVTHGLRRLYLDEDKEDRKDLDLTALSVACPDLQTLSTRHFNVVVSAHDEALRRWPIQDMDICATRSISDLTSCLSDSNLRMSKELVKLEVSSSKDEAFGQDEIVELQAHDGEFLPVIKEKFPLPSKLAMISIGMGGGTLKVVRHVDTYMLSLIFVLAATPVQRQVLCRRERHD